MKSGKSGAVIALFLMFAMSIPAIADTGGFLEGAGSLKYGDDKAQKDGYNMSELRFQLRHSDSIAKYEEYRGAYSFKGEALADGYDGFVRLGVREAYLTFSPVESVDVKLGRQIVTWGTGDLIFVNDIFPKDYNSFFMGRDDEYMKLPNDAVRVWKWSDAVSVDFVYIPYFKPNNTLDEDRFSFYDPLCDCRAGELVKRRYELPEKTRIPGEEALRLTKTFGSYDTALYAFRGFYKDPVEARIPPLRVYTYPRLFAYGFSVTGPVGGGIGNVEAAYYSSREDGSGKDPLVENSRIKLLFGYSMDLGDNLRLGVQSLTEKMLRYDAYEGALPLGSAKRDEYRELLTLRITKLFMSETLTLGAFIFYSPTDNDAYLRGSASYAVRDDLKVSVGFNVFGGRRDYTEFAQADGNDNVYMRVRYSF